MEFHSRPAPGHPQGEARAKERDSRPSTTGWIWFCTTLMMGPAVPMVFATHSVLVPLSLIAGAALSSASVWAFGDAAAKRSRAERQASEQERREAAQLRSHVQDLEHRLQALETIGRYEQARRERAEEARFGAPHQDAFDPLSSAPAPPASSRYAAQRGRNIGVMEG